MLRRKRLPDGSLGALENVFDSDIEDEIDEEKVALAEAIVSLESKVLELENKIAGGL